MTIEEKAGAYDEALRKAKNMLSCKEVRQEDMEYLFPELKESEDDKIRKGLIKDFRNYYNMYDKSCVEPKWGSDCMLVKDILNWLEKQGKETKEYTFKSLPRLLDMIEPSDRAKAYCQKLIDTLVREGYTTDAKIVEEVLKGWNGEDVPMAVMDEQTHIGEVNDDVMNEQLQIWFNKGKCSGRDEVMFHPENYGLQKQDEQSPFSGISFKYNGHTWGMCARDNGVDILLDKQLFKHLEKQNEQKVPVVDFKAKDWYVSKVDGKIHNIYNSVDKVEPKFHEGDWVIDNCGNVWKIEGILNQFYILEDIEGGESRPTIEWVDKTFHLWTIEDAKDGDVLDANGAPFIYKRHDKDYVYYYCGVNLGGEFTAANGNNIWNNNNKVYPATKEQHDLLFQKMKEAGYEWIVEKKEVKKIKFAKSESKEELSDFESALFSAFSNGWQQYLNGEEVDVAQWTREHSTELLEAANQNHIAWSEEDTFKVQRICEYLDEAKKYYADITEVRDNINWLKSLKNRLTGE